MANKNDKADDDEDASSRKNTGNQPAAEVNKATKTLAFRGGASNIPHDDKLHKGGEDAFTASERLIAVADGVGGWANRGVDPGLFSK